MRRWVKEQSLTLFFLAIFALSLIGQSFAGLHDFNAEQATHGGEPYSYWRFLVSSEFGGDVMENWQSEFLQFSLLILATVWFVQRGSTESKKVEDAGAMSDKEERVGEHAPAKAPRWAKVKDWRLKLYENSLGLAMVAIFFGTWFAQSLTNWTAYNNRQTEHGEAAVTWVSFLGKPTSGTGRCRTGSPSSSPWPRWPLSPSTCGSAARPSRSPWARPTTKRALPAN